ncbi:MAG: hypothetical protein CFH15_00490 [Alphaproteobacteria bacterium MarineAlpha5_Bin5]|nr:MAG: hypothetical protein CFH15_00490 [Alphaproteobacteria bacterium MarineAlpha5_Bin5]PPR51949.1 MAG: hypothetical protein CFH14_00585 [Alphaproteobacteria bacterium MarineAlpha5_Bin4]|tara:strand:- start:29776 stop:30165 length:390 start_codon:yes stop_codon:yes gene_type:complete
MIVKKILILINIAFFLYFSVQLLVFTDEFALQNIGFFNHAVAGLAEVIGIIFLSLSLALILIFFIGMEKQFPLFLTIFLIQFIIGINFWRYVITNSSGETNLETIVFNAIVFSIISIISFYILISNKKK